MIRQLRLSNWRAYDSLSLELGPGTTFIVAANGIGKTSLIEAAAWVLFGEYARPTHTPVRIGADHATASVDLQLPDGRMLSITRQMTAVRPRTAAEPSVLLDAEPITASALDSLLREAYGADPMFLAGIVMPSPERDASSRVRGPELTQHLCELLGVTGLIEASEELTVRIKANDRLIRAAKQGGSVTQSRLIELRRTADAADTVVADAAHTHTVARTALAAGQARAHFRQDLLAWKQRVVQRNDALVQAAYQAGDVLGRPFQPDTIQAELTRSAESLSEALDAAAREQGVAEGRAQVLRAAVAELAGAHGDCPVCRRALDESTVLSAREAHTQDLDHLAQRSRELSNERSSLTAQLSQIRALLAAAARIPDPGPQPVPADSVDSQHDDIRNDEIYDAPLGLLEEREEAALGVLVSARIEQAAAQAAWEAAAQDEHAHEELVGLFRRDAVLRAAKSALESSVKEVMDHTVEPLAHEIGPRWSALFPDRGAIQVDGSGMLSRSTSGVQLPLEAHSGGERTGAIVLLRLLVAQMMTKATFCWFDEPLEHLDPDTRRQVASLLAGAGSSHPLQQVVLTTYEESLAARLAADNPGRVNLVTVRSAV